LYNIAIETFNIRHNYRNIYFNYIIWDGFPLWKSYLTLNFLSNLYRLKCVVASCIEAVYIAHKICLDLSSRYAFIRTNKNEIVPLHFFNIKLFDWAKSLAYYSSRRFFSTLSHWMYVVRFWRLIQFMLYIFGFLKASCLLAFLRLYFIILQIKLSNSFQLLLCWKFLKATNRHVWPQENPRDLFDFWKIFFYLLFGHCFRAFLSLSLWYCSFMY
jgi:hypothetical protein